jgi:low affinity Fe/Cu permease
VWGVLGPYYNYSEVWQLIVNTGTTIVTFLMVFLLQNSTNREGRAVQVKLDEIIRVTENARNELISVEKKTDVEIEEIATTIAEEVKEVENDSGINKQVD